MLAKRLIAVSRFTTCCWMSSPPRHVTVIDVAVSDVKCYNDHVPGMNVAGGGGGLRSPLPGNVPPPGLNPAAAAAMMAAPPNNVRHVLHMQQQQKLAQRQQQQLAQRRQAAAAGLAGVPQLRMPGAQAGNGGAAGGGAFQQVSV